MLGKTLPSKSVLIWCALATLALEALFVVSLGTRPPGPVLSQAMQSVSAVLAAAACLRASHRGAGFARTFWRLAALALATWATAQVFGTYHLYVATLHPQVGPRNIMLYFFSFTPLFGLLFLTPGVQERDLRWESYLDFLQILIISAAFYLLFLHVPWWQLTEAQWAIRRAATVNFRNGLLCSCFLLRILSTRSPRYRELYLRLGSPMALYSLGFWVGKRGLTIWNLRLGSWFDVGWTVPFLLLAVLAETWIEQPGEREPARERGIIPIVLTFLMTVSLPAAATWLLRFRGSISDPEVYLICGSAAAAITCFFTRLALTQYRRQRTFEQLQSSERRYRSLFEGNVAGVFRTALDGRYLDCNEAYARIYGYASREEVLADTVFSRYANPADRTARIARLRQERVLTNMETLQLRKDGTSLWALHNLSLLKDEQGNEFIEGTILDVTERKRAEAAILQWKNRYEAAVQASGQILYDWNPSTNEVTFGGNVEHLLGYSATEIGDGKNRWRELISPEDLDRYIGEMNRVVATETEPLHIEYHMRRKDGRIVTVRDEGQFVFDEPNNVRRIVGFITDVTEQRALEEQLRQSQKMEAVGRLAGGLAHDFNNLLTVIKGYSRMVLDDPRRADKVKSNVEHIDAAAERAASLTRHLLAFSRKQVLRPERIDLNSLVGNLDNMLRRLIGEDVEVVTIPASNLGFVNADPGQIEQVIMNLVVNARDAMPNGGRITLETANVMLDAEYAREHEGVTPGNYVMLSVSDTGTGMDPQTQARIFEPFFTTKELGRGTGLGLSTVYGIVKQSGGHIWVYSEIGKGTTFKIYFARVKEPEGAILPAAKSTAKAEGDETILLVEDDEQVRILTHSILIHCGYSVLVAENGPALSKICTECKDHVDLLLTDVVMPGITGLEVARRVSARWPGIKVLFMSGYTENAIAIQGVLDEGTYFLSKPFTPTILASKIREVLDHAATVK